MTRAIKNSDIKDIDHLFKVIKSLPIKPRKVSKSGGMCTIYTSIALEKIYDNTDFSEINKRLEENNLSLAWDGFFGITSTEFIFTDLLKENE